MSFSRKIATLSIGRSFALIAVLAVIIAVGGVGYTLHAARNEMIALKRAEMKNAVEAAATTVKSYLARAEAGELKEADAKKMAMEAIGGARFDNGNYYFVVNYDGISLLHANKKIQSTDMRPLKDADGKFFVQDMIALVKAKGEGFLDYGWLKMGDTEPSLKISYVIGVPKWQWLIGSGLHVQDVDAAFLGMVGGVAKVLVPLGLIMLGLVIVLSRRSSRMLASLSSSMDELAAGNLQAEIAHQQRPDEIGSMARALVVFRDAALAKEAMEADKLRVEEEAAGHRSAVDTERRRNEAERAEQARVQADVVQALGAGLEHLAGGDLTYRIGETFSAEYLKLKDDFNAAIAKLQDAMRQIVTNTESMKAGSVEISQAADDLAGRTEQQASSVEETATALDQLTATVRQTAESARLANQATEQVKGEAEQSTSIVRDAVTAMGGIEKSAQEISQIVGVIDEIAFQTNLLALNASVEAARAGDAGKGFAVVASEVRTLAQRSGEAAKDISGLISSSNTEVGAGVKLVRQAGDQLARILEASQKVAATIADISAASGEQANGIDEMSQAVAHLDEMTQQNAALAEQSAASANALSGRIGQLNDLVATFRTGREAVGQTGYPQVLPSSPARPTKASRPAIRPAPAAAATTPAAGDSEPERLRQLAEAAFVQSRAAPAPRKVANGRAQDTGWEEF